MASQMMEDPQSVAAIKHLGQLREEYKTTALWNMAVLLLIILVVIVWFGYDLFTRMTSSFPIETLLILLVVAAVIGIGIVGFLRAYRKRHTNVCIYDQGLVYNGVDGMLAIRWDEIAQIEHEVIKQRHHTHGANGTRTTYTTRKHRYTVRCVDGTYLKLDEKFFNLRRLGKAIEEQSLPYLLPEAVKMLLANQDMPFGAFTVTMHGLLAGRRLLPWPELKKVKIDEYDGVVTIRQREHLFDWASVPLAEVPNVWLLDALVKRMMEG